MEIPPVVTMTEAAALLVALGIEDHMTNEGIRKVSKSNPDWPFGPGKKHPWRKVGNAPHAMDTEPFLEFWRHRKIKGRGPDKEPRKRQPRAK